MNSINLEQFLFKKVQVKTMSGEEYVGLVIGHWSAEENEGEESIGMAESRYSHNGYEVLRSEIKSIETV